MYGTLAAYYDRVYHGKEYPREARQLLRLAAREIRRPPRSLLDVGCGTGLHLAEFHKALRVAGVDSSPEMLQIARRRLGRMVPLVKGDMRRFSFRSTFDVVTCLFSAISYMESRKDRDAAIANFARHLAPGGVAIVEGWVLPEKWKGTALGWDTYEDQDVRIVRVSSGSRDGDHSVVEFHWLIAERGKRIRHFTEIVRQPLVSSAEMIGSFRRAGLRARVLLKSPYQYRGLYLGLKPLSSTAVGPKGRRPRLANRPASRRHRDSGITEPDFASRRAKG
jgi:dTDP-3-amino-3,4,6-trideoxy-alpha-D-glucopyranose N,N-dimethyltransferase